MFSKKNLSHLRRQVKLLDKETERRKRVMEKRNKKISYSHDEVERIIENYTLLGCRFGIYVLFQIQNQDDLREMMKDILTSKLKVDQFKLEDDSELLKILMQENVHEVIGKDIHRMVMDLYTNNDEVNHAQAVLAKHGEQDISELVEAVVQFSGQVDNHHEEQKEHAPLSQMIN